MSKPKYIYCDFETQSAVNINDPTYLTHDTTRVLTFVWGRGNDIHMWVNPRAMLPLGYTVAQIKHVGKFKSVTRDKDGPPIDPDAIYVAHNGEMFDARIAERYLPKIKRWADTLHLCRLHGLPGALKDVVPALGLGEKLDNDAIMKMTKAKLVMGAVTYPRGDKRTWDDLVHYARNDVVILEKLHKRLLKFSITDRERELIEIHQRINNRGFMVDIPYAVQLVSLWDQLGVTARKDLAKVTEGKLTGDDVRSPAKVKDYLAAKGLRLGSIDKRIVDRLIEGESEIKGVKPAVARHIRDVLALRKLATRVSGGKVTAFLERTNHDGYVRHWANYHGAGPGRWSGRGCQPHNIPRGHAKLGIDTFMVTEGLTMKAVNAEAKRLSKGGLPVSSADVLSSLTRGIIIPRTGKLGTADYSAVECRGVAWLANCERLLRLFNAGGDVYLDFGSELFGRKLTKEDDLERFVSKQIVLGCGYQMGARKFEEMCWVYRIDLEKVNLTGKRCVDAYRKAYPEVTYIWSKYHKLAIESVKNKTCVYDVQADVSFDCTDEFLAIRLPSGRELRYWCPVVRMEYPTAFVSPKPLPHLYYQSHYRGEQGLYGGKILENIVQGFCRDILAAKIVELEANQLPVILHVHDEIACELEREKQIHEQCAIMSRTPVGEWYETFPLGCEGHTSTRYCKAKPSTSIKVKYHRGKQI